MREIDRILTLALTLTDSSAEFSLEAWHNDLAVTYKSDGSSLTEVDLSIEKVWRERIRHQFPSHGILGEEFGSDRGHSAYTWVLDPIDGTRQFGAGLLNYASLISVCRDELPVLGIIDMAVPGVRYVAVEGRGTVFGGRTVRSSGRGELDRAIVSLANPDSFRDAHLVGYNNLRAAGRLRVFDGGAPAYGALARGLIDICLNGGDLDAYDICALCPIVSEAGGVISDWDGRSLSLTSSGAIVASASVELHASVLDRLAQRS